MGEVLEMSGNLGTVALERLAAHEKECAARYASLETRLQGIETQLGSATKLLLKIVLAVGLVGAAGPQAIPILTKMFGAP